MATLSQINAVVTGFPLQLSWGQFRTVAQSPKPPMQAQTSAAFSMGPWRTVVVNKQYRVQGARFTVRLNAAATWAVSAAKSNAALLRHEQVHFDITGLIARDLASNVLDLSLDVDTVAALKDSGTTANAQLQYVQRRFQTSVNEFGDQARSLLNQLQTNPTTGADGVYDVQTRHGQNAGPQATWENLTARVKSSGVNFRLALAQAGIL